MKDNIDRFDTSNYMEDNRFSIPVTKLVLGKMKDEFTSDIIDSFYGHGTKAYYILSLKSDMKKAKREKNLIEKELSGEDYKNFAENEGILFRKMNTFKSILHNIYTTRTLQTQQEYYGLEILIRVVGSTIEFLVKIKIASFIRKNF